MSVRKYSYRVYALGLEFATVAMNIERLREQGWELLSTYVDVNRGTVGQEKTVVGVFETWEKVKSRGIGQ